MQTVSCPICGDSLPEADRSCARCEAAASTPDVTLCAEQEDISDKRIADAPVQQTNEIPPEPSEAAPTIKLTRKATKPRVERPQDLEEISPTIKLTRKATRTKSKAEPEPTDATLNLKQLRQGARAHLEADMRTPDEETLIEEDQDDEVVTGHATWQKVVEPKTPPMLPVVIISSSNTRHGNLVSALRPRWCSPSIFLWLNVLLLCSLLLAGGFSVAIGLTRNTPRAVAIRPPMLQSSPGTIALGGILTLRGTQFDRGDQIALSRDKHIPVVDTGGARSVQADAHGGFNDTVIVDPTWLSGLHTLYATDTRTHRQSHVTIWVTGQDALQGPPHLLLSADSLNLGTGDVATNGNKLLALSNAGGGQVTWQASTGQSWLQISPSSGTISSGSPQSAIVAVDRSGMTPGSYQATILFDANTAQISLTVTMQVIPLQPSHQAVLQLSPAALTFTGSAQGPAPQTQTITVSNPGVQTLAWTSNVSMYIGYGWLWMTPQAGNIAPGGQQQIIIGVSTPHLSPGVYRGAILFTNQGSQPIQGSPQSIYVSLTVTPACTLALGPTHLSFTGTHSQGAPSGQSLNVNTAQGCRTSQTWNASVSTSNGGNWLRLSQSRASTPSSTLVSADTSGLGPGTYNGTLTFTVNTGPQIVPVTLTVSPLPCTVAGSPTLALQGTAGQASPVAQAVTLSTGGDCLHSLNWTSAVSGATWLSATPSGTLTQPGTASVNEQASLTGLSAGTYTGTVTVTVVDSVTGATVGTVQTTVTLTILQACTLQAVSSSTLTFSASVGTDPSPATQSFTISATGNCAGNVTITPATDGGSNAWLAISGPATIASGGTATVTVTVTSSALVANPYNGTITLTAADGNGPIAGSPQTVSVSLTVS